MRTLCNTKYTTGPITRYTKPLDDTMLEKYDAPTVDEIRSESKQFYYKPQGKM